ncbi:MAG: DUF4350 domain-containing protein [Candidatus Asgardarchaeia archaeon]
MPEKKSKSKRIKKKEAKSVRYAIFFTLLFISWVPIITPLAGIHFNFTTDFSIYNTSQFGASDLKNELESLGYQVKPLYSSLSALNKLEKPGVLIILGPKRTYDFPDALAIIDFLLHGGSILISDDEGTANTLLSYFSIVNVNISFGPGILVDVLSNYRNRPVLPVIRNFVPSPLTQGPAGTVRELVLNYATIINGTVPPIAWSSNMSWADIDGDLYPDPDIEHPGPFIVVSAIDLSLLIPNGGKIVLVSDPSLFTNLMLDYGDNRIFAINTISWLADYNTSHIIIFDEGHLGLPVSDVFFFSIIMNYATIISSNWVLAPLFPFMAVYFARKWLPKAKRAKPFSPTKVFRRRGETYFSEMIRKYKQSGAYAHALKILYRKWKKELSKEYGLSPFATGDKIYSLIVKLNPQFSSDKVKRIIHDLDSGKLKHISKEEFVKIFIVFESITKKSRGGQIAR